MSVIMIAQYQQSSNLTQQSLTGSNPAPEPSAPDETSSSLMTAVPLSAESGDSDNFDAPITDSEVAILSGGNLSLPASQTSADGPAALNNITSEDPKLPPDTLTDSGGTQASPMKTDIVQPMGSLADKSGLVQTPQSLSAEGVQTLTSAVGISSPPISEMSIKDMFLGADPIVQGVMIILLLASMATWMVILEKLFILNRAFRSMNRFKQAAIDLQSEINLEDIPPMTRSIVKSGMVESTDSVGRECRADFRERVEKAMKTVLSTIMRRLGRRSLILATIGSVSPFVGLFGTVWGIMHSFIGIAASGETTLAVVAPGIAEALFATAMGLVAAIPAVIGYNKITSSIKEITLEGVTALSLVGNHLARLHYGNLEDIEKEANQHG